MKNELYRKLVDLYAGGELPAELEEDLRAQALTDSDLAVDMRSLQDTLDAIHRIPAPEFTEESYQRILMKVYARGADIVSPMPIPSHLQYHLPMQG
jgi:hypothetical protein